MTTDNKNLLSVKDLTIRYVTDDGTVAAVSNMSFNIGKGKTLGLVGETGAGKTTTALGIMRLIPDPPGEIVSGEIFYDGEDILKISENQMKKVRGSKISMIFQDPMTSLNPVMTIGEQITEVILLHNKVSKADAMKRACDMIEMVGIPADRYSEYPHQFSGGMKQRIVIAMALACEPNLLLADEPTTALDVTIQAQVLDLISNLRKELGTSMLLITHDLGVVAEVCDDVAIIYAGQIIESGSVQEIFENTLHPYTKGLFTSIPRLEEDSERLISIPGLMPDPTNLPSGCSFHPRCSMCEEICKKETPKPYTLPNGHLISCHVAKREQEAK